MRFYRVPILCFVDNSEVNQVNELLENLEIEVKQESETAYKDSLLNADHIINCNGGTDDQITLVDTTMGKLTVGMPWENFRELIGYANA